MRFLPAIIRLIKIKQQAQKKRKKSMVEDKSFANKAL